IKASYNQASEKKIFNNAAQVWNHTFYWNCLAPKAGGDPTGNIKAAIDKSFGSFADFKTKFTEAAMGQFGSGWVWVRERGGGVCERRHGVRGGQDVRPHDRRVGARVLHRLSQRAREVRRRVLEARQLGLREQELRLVTRCALTGAPVRSSCRRERVISPVV